VLPYLTAIPPRPKSLPSIAYLPSAFPRPRLSPPWGVWVGRLSSFIRSHMRTSFLPQRHMRRTHDSTVEAREVRNPPNTPLDGNYDGSSSFANPCSESADRPVASRSCTRIRDTTGGMDIHLPSAPRHISDVQGAEVFDTGRPLDHASYPPDAVAFFGISSLHGIGFQTMVRLGGRDSIRAILESSDVHFFSAASPRLAGGWRRAMSRTIGAPYIALSGSRG
jgi:hypothetical protein